MPTRTSDDRHVYVVSGVKFTVVAERVQYYDATASSSPSRCKDYTRRPSRRSSRTLDDFLKRWKTADRKQAIVEELRERGVLLEALEDAVGRDLDPFDLICHVAFDQPALTRRERADNVRKRDVFTKYGDQAREVLDALLDKYADQGLDSIGEIEVLKLDPFPELGTPIELVSRFGGTSQYLAALRETRRRPLRTRADPEPSCPSRTTIKSIQDIMRKDAGVDGDAQRIGQLGWMLFLKIFDDLEIETELEDDDYESPLPAAPALGRVGRRGLLGRALDRRRAARPRQQLAVPDAQGPQRRQLHRQGPPARRAAAQRVRGRLQLHEVRHVDAPGDQQDQPRHRLQRVDDRHTFGDIYEQILNDLQSAGNAGEFYTPRAVTQFIVDMVDPAARRDRARPRLRHRRLPHLRLSSTCAPQAQTPPTKLVS